MSLANGAPKLSPEGVRIITASNRLKHLLRQYDTTQNGNLWGAPPRLDNYWDYSAATVTDGANFKIGATHGVNRPCQQAGPGSYGIWINCSGGWRRPDASQNFANVFPYWLPIPGGTAIADWSTLSCGFDVNMTAAQRKQFFVSQISSSVSSSFVASSGGGYRLIDMLNAMSLNEWAQYSAVNPVQNDWIWCQIPDYYTHYTMVANSDGYIKWTTQDEMVIFTPVLSEWQGILTGRYLGLTDPNPHTPIRHTIDEVRVASNFTVFPNSNPNPPNVSFTSFGLPYPGGLLQRTQRATVNPDLTLAFPDQASLADGETFYGLGHRSNPWSFTS